MRGLRFAVAGALAAGMVVVVQAQPGGFGRGGGGPSGLVANKAVQEDLKLSEDQVTKVTAWAKEFGKTAQKIREDKGVKGFGGGGFGKQPSPEEQEKIDAANAEITKVAYKELGEVLKKEQVDRVKQIARQQMGLRAFTDAETAAALKLTDTQKASVKGISGDFQKESREIRGEPEKGKFDLEKFQENQKKVEKVQKEFMSKVVDVLEDGQKKTWKELVGEPFDLTKLQFGGPPKKKD